MIFLRFSDFYQLRYRLSTRGRVPYNKLTTSVHCCQLLMAMVTTSDVYFSHFITAGDLRE